MASIQEGDIRQKEQCRNMKTAGVGIYKDIKGFSKEKGNCCDEASCRKFKAANPTGVAQAPTKLNRRERSDELNRGYRGSI